MRRLLFNTMIGIGGKGNLCQQIMASIRCEKRSSDKGCMHTTKNTNKKKQTETLIQHGYHDLDLAVVSIYARIVMQPFSLSPAKQSKDNNKTKRNNNSKQISYSSLFAIVVQTVLVKCHRWRGPSYICWPGPNKQRVAYICGFVVFILILWIAGHTVSTYHRGVYRHDICNFIMAQPRGLNQYMPRKNVSREWRPLLVGTFGTGRSTSKIISRTVA